MFKRNKAGNGRIGRAGAGMETWKLAVIVSACIVLAMMGGITLELIPKSTAQAEMNLGFDAPSEVSAAPEGQG